MSTDYDVVCVTCRKSTHLGVRFSSNFAFGHGSFDLEEQRRAGAWIVDHLNEGHELKIEVSDAVPDDYEHDQ